MILYFTGTGNSRYAARKIGKILGEEPVSLNTYIKEETAGEFTSEKPYVFVVPTYAWQIPHVVRDFILHSHFSGSGQAYFVLTCGMSAGGAGEALLFSPRHVLL
ncbi:MAG: flavodoxin, partial [Eubacterium sp.]|nr:flavodoxin [Eubacterium sp.]